MIDQIARYWDKQSAIWAGEKEEVWTEPVTRHWLEYFKSIRHQLPGNRVLEVGTASGYFANILSLAGYNVTAVDLSPNMIGEAKRVAANLSLPADFQVMNAEELTFEDAQFDMVFTRLMTWTIPDVKKTYSEMFRVLRPGGWLLNFDGNFGEHKFSQEGHEKYPADIMEQANAIKAQLEVSKHQRPAWDLELLDQTGFVDASADYASAAEILHQNSSDIFKLQAKKPR